MLSKKLYIMTRVLHLQPSPQFLSNQMVSQQVKPDLTPKRRQYGSRSISKTPLKAKRRSRPTYTKMIEEAVFEKCVKRKGASLYTIKKYLEEKYDVDVKKSAKRICKCIREATSPGGNLRQMTGSGANGTFALVSFVKKRLQVEKEKFEIEKSARSINTRSSKIKSASSVPVNKREEMKVLKANSRKTSTPVTRMRVL